MAHVIGAMVVSLTILIVCAFVLHQFPSHPSLRPAVVALLSITLVQVFLGMEAYYTRLSAKERPLAMVLMTVAHVATGALTLASSIVLAIQIRRNVREDERCMKRLGDFDLTKPRITCTS